MANKPPHGRRQFLAGGAALGGLAWARPQIRSVAATGVSPTSPPPTSESTTSESTTSESTTSESTSTTEVPLPPLRFTLEPSCSEAEPYSEDLVLQPLEDGTSYHYSIHVRYRDGSTFDDAFYFVASETQRFPHVAPNAVQPYEIEYIDFFLDRNRDGTVDLARRNGTIIDGEGYFNVSRPCEDDYEPTARSSAKQRVKVHIS